MFWVLLFAAIAVLAVLVLVAYGVWLAHRVSDLWSEVTMVLGQVVQLGELAASVGRPETRPGPKREGDLYTPRSDGDLVRVDVG